MPSDIMESMRAGGPSALFSPFIRGPVEQQKPFCRLFAMQRSINKPSQKWASVSLRTLSGCVDWRACWSAVLH